MATVQPYVPSAILGQLVNEISTSRKSMDALFNLGKGEPLTANLIEKKGGTKLELAKTIVLLMRQMKNNVELMQISVGEIEKCRELERKRSEEVLSLQKDLLSKSAQIETIEKSVENKFNTYSDAVRVNMEKHSHSVEQFSETLKSYEQRAINRKHIDPSPLLINDLQKCVKEAVIRTAIETDKKKNLIITGLPESADESQFDLESDAYDVLDAIVDYSEDDVMDASYEKPILMKRLGKTKDIVSRPRPVLVSFSSPDVVHAFLKRRKFLKKTPRFKKVYISQDFTAEERVERRQLVEKLKEKIKQSPDERHYIFNGQVYSDQNAKKVDNLDTTTFNFLFDTTES